MGKANVRRVRVWAPAVLPPDPAWIASLVQDLPRADGGVEVQIHLSDREQASSLADHLEQAFGLCWCYLEAQGACDAEGGAEWRRISEAWARQGRKVIEDFIRTLANVRPDPPHAGRQFPADRSDR